MEIVSCTRGAIGGLLIDEDPGRGSSLSTLEFERSPDRRRRAAVRAFVPEPSRVALPQSRAWSRCPELDCLRGRLPPGTLAAAEQRATTLGLGADRVLITSGLISEDDYVRALAGWLHVPFDRLELPREACPLPAHRLRAVGAATRWRAWRALRLATGDLPVYTIVVALYDEASAVPALVAALGELDYPAEKLQVIFVLEPNDLPTRNALLDMNLGAPFEMLAAPDFGPRTKPKALNAALALAKGTFIAVFDAEDRPAPDQLHRALDAFLGNGSDIACVQARLTIDNTADGWLARLFTAEYAGQFDVLLPGLAQLRLPLPLGGSSNHFRGIR